ncbi:MAG: type II toxin-antitoxin system RelE family toxin [Nocardioides sp.]
MDHRDLATRRAGATQTRPASSTPHPIRTRPARALDDPAAPCKPLSGPLAGFWRYRVGDYRIILDIDQERVMIIALDLGHRSDIYD